MVLVGDEARDAARELCRLARKLGVKEANFVTLGTLPPARSRQRSALKLPALATHSSLLGPAWNVYPA